MPPKKWYIFRHYKGEVYVLFHVGLSGAGWHGLSEGEREKASLWRNFLNREFGHPSEPKETVLQFLQDSRSWPTKKAAESFLKRQRNHLQLRGGGVAVVGSEVPDPLDLSDIEMEYA